MAHRTWELLKCWEYIKRLTIISIPWIATGMSSYGIHFSVKLVYFDLFTVVVLKEAAIIISILLSMWIFERVNLYLIYCIMDTNIITNISIHTQIHRTTCLTVSYMMSGLITISYFLVPIKHGIIRIIIFVLSQAMIVADFYMVDTYTQDIFSTDIRQSTFNILDSLSKVFRVCINMY